MLIPKLYFIVILLANIVGAISGLGGGSIIKPVLDFMNIHSVQEIGLFSSFAVFIMSISSTIKQIINKVSINWSTALIISVGSLIGGACGTNAFEYLLHHFINHSYVTLVQIIITCITLLFSYIYTEKRWKSFHWQTPLLKLAVGFLLGFLSSLLGIGGGPLNVALLMYCFGMTIKEATVYSIITILFSQISKLTIVVASQSYRGMDINMLIYILPAAVLGGHIGGSISGKLNEGQVQAFYQIVIVLILIINIYNALMILI